MNIQASTKPQSEPVKYVKCFRHYVPVYPGEEEHLEKDIQTLEKARKFRKKLLKKSELAFTADKQAKKAARHYLRSIRCLQANMIKANARRPLKDRLSLHQIIEQSEKSDMLKNLNEPATIFSIPKPDGGSRQICDFGPVARGAQRMVLKLLRAAYKPVACQFARLSVKDAIQTALKAITEEDLHHVAEIDIKGHFPSFTAGDLIKALPLPKAAVEQIIMAENATWTGPFVPTGLLPVFPQSPTGIPQGSAASSEVAIWSVSHLKVPITVNSSVIVNYADNFFVFANSKFALDATCNLLRSAIAGLPGGGLSKVC